MAIDVAKRLHEELAEASGHGLLGQLYEGLDQRSLADKEFRLARRLLNEEGAKDRLAEAHASYAEVLEARGDGRRAGQHWRQAATLALGRQVIPLRPVRAG